MELHTVRLTATRSKLIILSLLVAVLAVVGGAALAAAGALPPPAEQSALSVSVSPQAAEEGPETKGARAGEEVAAKGSVYTWHDGDREMRVVLQNDVPLSGGPDPVIAGSNAESEQNGPAVTGGYDSTVLPAFKSESGGGETSLPGLPADGGVDTHKGAPEGQEQEAPPIPERAGLSYPSLGSHLDQLVTSVEAGQATAQDAASNSAVHSGESVAVTISLSGNVDEVVSFLEDNGGDPRNVGEDYIEAYVPVALLGAVSEQPGVVRVRQIVPPQPVQTFQTIIGHGPAAHGSQAWNQAGYSGQGVKVGVIDVGFRGLTSLMGTELPATVHARCYTDVGEFTENLADCEAPEPVSDSTIPECRAAIQPEASDHGTVVAESVLDIAPGVELYVSQPGSRADLQETAEWMASQGVSVINHSVGRGFDGTGDGTSPSSISPLRTVDQSVASGVIWVNSAGNSGRTAWFGDYSDPDGNTAISFGGQNDEVINIFAWRA